jgi:hypothetical protein
VVVILGRLPFALLLVLLGLPAVARADWTVPVPVTPVMDNGSLFGAAAPADVPAVLVTRRVRAGHYVLELRRAVRARGPLRAPVTVASSEHSFFGANGTSSLGGGPAGGDLSAAWLQLINGVRRPVVATGPQLADRQVLTGAGSRNTQVMAYASNRLGDAVVAFWRYAGKGATSYEVLASYRHAGQAFGTPQLVATGSPGFPVVTIGEGGGAAVGWSTPQGFAVAEHLDRDEAAGGFAPSAVVPGSAGAGEALALAEGDNGRAVAAWTVRGKPGGVLVSRRAPGSGAWGNPITLNTSGVAVRAALPPGLAVDRDQTEVAWTETTGAKPSHDVVRYAVGRGSAWDASATPIDPGLRGRTVRAQLVAPALGRPALLVASAFNVHRIATATVRPDGTLGPERTIMFPSAAPLFAWPLAAQGSGSTWLAFERATRGGEDVALSRSR